MQKIRFREYQTTRFMDILDHDFNHWYSQYWKSAADEVMKSLLRGKPMEEYLNEIFLMLNELIDQGGRMPNFAASVFGFWCSKVEADILKVVKAKQEAESKSKTGKAIFERHRKTIKRELDKYVNAFRVLKELSEQTDYTLRGQTGLAGYLGDNDYTRVHPPFNATGRMLKDLLVDNPSFSVEVKTSEDLDEIYKNIYDDYLEVQLTVTPLGAKPRKFQLEFRNDDTSFEFLIFYLKEAIEHFARKKFGDEGYLIADMMIDGVKPDNPRKENGRKPGRPQELHLDRMILFLDDHEVDEVWIARFINTLENMERYKEMHGGEEYRSRLGKYVPVAETNMRRAIRMRIKKLGGNILRFEIDEIIKRKNECRKCDWRYKEDGELIRIPCNRHLDSPKEIGVSKANPDWAKYLERRGLSYYANALTFK